MAKESFVFLFVVLALFIYSCIAKEDSRSANSKRNLNDINLDKSEFETDLDIY